MFIKYSLIFGFIALIIGCDDEPVDPSSRVSTTQTYVEMRVSVSNTEKATAVVQLLNVSPASGNQVELSNGDELWFSYGQNVTELAFDRNDNLFDAFDELVGKINRLSGGQAVDRFFWFEWSYGNTWYAGVLDEIDNETYYISYLRRNYADALNSYVTLPERFTISAPLANEVHSRTNNIIVNWQPSGTTLNTTIRALVNCAGNVGENYQHTFSVPSDTGTYTIPAGALSNSLTSGNCVTTLEVSKSQTGTIDPDLYGGAIIGERLNTVSFTTTD